MEIFLQEKRGRYKKQRIIQPVICYIALMEAKFYLTDNRLRVLITALPKVMEVMHNLVCKQVYILVWSQDCNL